MPDADHEFAVFLCYCCNVLSVVEQQLVDASVLDGTVSEVLHAGGGGGGAEVCACKCTYMCVNCTHMCMQMCIFVCVPRKKPTYCVHRLHHFIFFLAAVLSFSFICNHM